MPKPSYLNLLSHYPSTPPPACDGPYINQCAIRLSMALNGERTLTVDKGTYTEPKCAHGHARGAESLANWLYDKIGRPKIYTDGADAKKKIAGKNGIIFFKDCFQRDGEATRRGDHIDLWDGFTGRTYNDDANLASQVWFWELK